MRNLQKGEKELFKFLFFLIAAGLVVVLISFLIYVLMCKREAQKLFHKMRNAFYELNSNKNLTEDEKRSLKAEVLSCDCIFRNPHLVYFKLLDVGAQEEVVSIKNIVSTWKF